MKAEFSADGKTLRVVADSVVERMALHLWNTWRDVGGESLVTDACPRPDLEKSVSEDAQSLKDSLWRRCPLVEWDVEEDENGSLSVTASCVVAPFGNADKASFSHHRIIIEDALNVSFFVEEVARALVEHIYHGMTKGVVMR